MPECMEALVSSHPATVHVCLRHLRDAGLEEIQWLSLLDFWSSRRSAFHIIVLGGYALHYIETERVVLFELSHNGD